MRRVHPLTDAHTAGVIHSLREMQSYQGPVGLIFRSTTTVGACRNVAIARRREPVMGSIGVCN